MSGKQCCSVLTMIWSFLVFFSFWGLIVFGYGYYAFSPHSDLHASYDCFASNSKDVENIAYSKQNEDGSLHNVTANFQVVVYWGFFTYALMLSIFSCLLCNGENGCLTPCLAILAFITGCSYIGHFLTLMILRWRHAGKVCAGDYLSDPNRFAILGEKEPYLHDTGSFLFYAINSQFFFYLMMMSGASIFAGIES